MEKIRLKCCPFCGCEQLTIRKRSGCIFVECDQCLSRGSGVDVSELMDGFVEAAPNEEIDRALKELAADRWNCRPPMADCYPEDVRRMWRDWRKKAKLEGGALYGSSVYKD